MVFLQNCAKWISWLQVRNPSANMRTNFALWLVCVWFCLFACFLFLTLTKFLARCGKLCAKLIVQPWKPWQQCIHLWMKVKCENFLYWFSMTYQITIEVRICISSITTAKLIESKVQTIIWFCWSFKVYQYFDLFLIVIDTWGEYILSH